LHGWAEQLLLMFADLLGLSSCFEAVTTACKFLKEAST
jgi:hypothetical protein